MQKVINPVHILLVLPVIVGGWVHFVWAILSVVLFGKKRCSRFCLSMVLAFSTLHSGATTYYLATAAKNNASTAGNWYTDATGGGGGSSASNFTTNGDVFIIISSITGARFESNVTFGSSSASVTLQIDGDAYVRTGSRVLTIGESGATSFLVLTATGSSSITDGKVTIASGSTVKTANGNGFVGTNCAIAAAVDLTFNAAANIEFNGSGAQLTTGLPPSFANFTVSGSSSTTQNLDITVGGVLSIGNGATFITASTHILTVAGSTLVDGTFTLGGTGTKTFTGDVTINSGVGRVWNETSTATINFGGSLAHSGATFTASTTTHTFSGISQTISGTSTITIPNIIITGSVSNTGILVATATLSGAGTLIQGVNGSLTISGTSAISTLTANGTGNTVTYNGGSAQTIKTSTYYNLIVNNSSGVSLEAATSVINNLTLTNGNVTLSTFDLTVNGSVLSATSSKYIKTTGTGRLKLNIGLGSGAVTFPVGNSAYNPLIITNSGTIDLYAIRVIDVVSSPVANNSTKLISRYWSLTEAVANGSNLSLTAQWNSGEENANYNAGTNVKFGYYNGSFWAEVLSSQVGANPYTAAGSYNLTSSDLTSGVVFGVGKDNGFIVSAPLISVSSVSAFGDQCNNTTSTENTYTVSGANLTADIIVTAPSRYEVSTTSGSGFGSSVTLTQSGGYVNSTTIYVRFLPNALSLFSGNITHASTGATTQNVAVSGTGVNTSASVANLTSANIGTTTATLGGEITAIGCSNVTTRGIEYSTTNGFANGTGTQSSSVGTFGIGTYTHNITGLTINTTYYYKAFVTNSGGTVYTSQGSFSTVSAARYSVASNDWNTTATWSATSGGAPGASVPGNGQAVFVEGGFSVTVSSSTSSLSSLNIAAGSSLSQTGSNKNVTTTDLIINGTYTKTGTGSINTTTITVGSGGKYIHAVDGQTLPTATWNANSTCEITSVAYSELSGLNQSFGNLTWDCASQNGTKNFPNTGTLSVAGTLTIKNTNGNPLRLNQSSLNVVNYVQTGGSFVNITNNAIITASGNVTISGGILDLANTGSLIGTLRIGGDFSYTSGTITENTSNYAEIVFNGNSKQTVTSGGTLSNDIRLTINSGAIVDFGTQVISGSTGVFTLNGGGTIITKHVQGLALTGSSGSIQVSGTRAYAAGGHYVYNGTSAQVTGNGFVQGASLTIDNAAGVTLSNPVNLNIGTLTIGATTPNAILSDGGNQLSGTGVLQLTSGTLKIGAATATTLPNFGTFNLATGTTIEYASSSTQTVSSAPSYKNIVLSGTGAKNANGNITVNELLTLSSGEIFNMSTYQLLGALTTISNSGTIQTSSTVSPPIPNGKTWGGMVVYAATSGGQTVSSGTYNNLTLNNTSGTNTANGDISVNGTFTSTSGGVLSMSNYQLLGSLTTISNSGTIQTASTAGQPIPSGKTWGGTVVYAATNGSQTISTGTYNNLSLNNTSGTSTANGDLTVNGTFASTSGGVLNMSTYQLLGSLTTISNSGTIQTASVANPPIPVGKTWGGTVVYAVSSGGQTAATGIYNNLILNNTSGANTVNGDITVNGTLASTSGGALNMSTYQLLGSLTAVNNSGIIQTASIANPPIPTGKTWGGTVVYSVTGGLQTVSAASYENLTLSNTSHSNTIGGDVVVGGVLALSGGQLALGSNTITINGTISGMSASSCFTANGSSNISIGGSGTLGTNLFLDQSSPGVSNRLNNLTYNRVSQTITLGDTVEIIGTLTPTAGELATAGKLKLISTVSGTARVAQGSGTYISGDVTIERFIPAAARRWRFCGSPVSGRTMADLQDDIFVTGPGGAANGFDVTLANYASIYSYDETVTTGDFTNGWTACGNITDPIVVGKGYRIFIRGDRDPGRLDGTISSQNEVTTDVTGVLNKGDISLPVTLTSSGSAPNDGWNLVANPYASAIDWNAWHDAGRTGVDSNFSGTDYAHIKQTVYIFDATTNSYTSFNALSNSGTGQLSSGIIPAGAAFWVQAIAASPALILKEVYKTAATPAAVFKTSAEQFTIKLIQDSITSDEAAFKYVPGTSGGLDGYDISKLYGSDVNISSIGVDGSFLAANCKPFNGFSDTIMLSLGFANSGEYTMEFNNPEGLGLDADKTIYLVDLFKQQVIDVNKISGYHFTVAKNDSATYGNSRFMIVVGEISMNVYEFTSTQASEPKIYLYPNTTTGKTTIYSDKMIPATAEVVIRDLTGKTITRLNNMMWVENKLELDLSHNQSGIYFMTIEDKGKVIQTLKCIKR